MVLVTRCQTLLEDLWSYEVVVYMYLRVLLHNIFFINVYMVLFLLNNVIYVFLLFSLYVYV